MPTEPSELDSFWIQEFAKRPPTPRALAKKKSRAKNAGAANGAAESESDSDTEGRGDGEATHDGGDADWTKFFDENDSTPGGETLKNGTNGAGPGVRVHTLTVHQCLHNLSSHRLQFSICWQTLLPRIAQSEAACLRVLKVFHRGVLPHVARPIDLMDWIAGCVDFGGSLGLLALNALFTLITKYNLSVFFFPLLFSQDVGVPLLNETVLQRLSGFLSPVVLVF